MPKLSHVRSNKIAPPVDTLVDAARRAVTFLEQQKRLGLSETMQDLARLVVVRDLQSALEQHGAPTPAQQRGDQ